VCLAQVLQGLDAATSVVEDMDEWLSIFNVKLRHMREDIASVRTCTLQFKNINFLDTVYSVVVMAVFTGSMNHLFSFPCSFGKAREFMYQSNPHERKTFYK